MEAIECVDLGDEGVDERGVVYGEQSSDELLVDGAGEGLSALLLVVPWFFVLNVLHDFCCCCCCSLEVVLFCCKDDVSSLSIFSLFATPQYLLVLVSLLLSTNVVCFAFNVS